MRLERFYDDDLAQASYLIACDGTGEALVVDPNLDTEQYVTAAARYGLRIVAVTETHIHADFLSGARALARLTGARLYLSGAGPAEWQYTFDEPSLVRLADGDAIELGAVRVRALHTPGHTPEHLAFLVTDSARGDIPVGLFSGDFVFVGDIGRPDLLERAAGMEGTMAAGARQLFASLRRFRELPDHVQVWPGHGAGSACGKALGAMPHSTVGYERLFNWAMQTRHEAAFVATVLAGQPEPPRYFARMKRLNRDAQPTAGGVPALPMLDAAALARLLADGGAVIDTRQPADFEAGFIPGSVNVNLRRGFTTWAGAMFPDDPPAALIGSAAAACTAARQLTLIGFTRLEGYAPVEVLAEWERTRGPLATLPRLTTADAHARWQAGAAVILDVRGRSEHAGGHIPGALNIPLPEIARRLDEIPKDATVLVH